MIRNKKLAIGLVIMGGFLVFALTVYFFNRDKLTTVQFNGNLSDVTDTSIIVNGVYVVINKETGKEEAYPADSSIDIEAIVGANTKITRLGIHIPNTTEMIVIDEMEKEESIVDFQKMKQDFDVVQSTIGIEIKADRNIINKGKFKAKEIIYRLPIFEIPRI